MMPTGSADHVASLRERSWALTIPVRFLRQPRKRLAPKRLARGRRGRKAQTLLAGAGREV